MECEHKKFLLMQKHFILPHCMMNIRIKQNSLRAKFAAVFLNKNNMAIVFGRTIYLHNINKENFLKNKKWVRHEVQHVFQYQQYGLVSFIFKYLLESIKHGYKNNCFETEACEKENDVEVLKNICFI